MQNLSVVQFAVLGSQEDKTWRNLAGLAWSAYLGAGTESFHLLSRSGSRLKRSMHWSRGDRVDSDAFRHKIFRQRASERYDSTFGGRIVNHRSRTAKGDCGCGVDDANQLAMGIHVLWGGNIR